MNDEPLRPDPDRLLEQTPPPHRGKLKIFFGACAGVGKTWAMLAQAQRLRAQGLDVVIGVANVHLDALEHGDTIAFMHSVQDGAASKSYGLAVAALAGVPKEVIKRARQKLRELESISPNAAATQVDGTQMSLLAAPEETSPAVEALENLDPDSLTPRQALEWIYRLKSLV